jgi:hypothetical protein
MLITMTAGEQSKPSSTTIAATALPGIIVNGDIESPSGSRRAQMPTRARSEAFYEHFRETEQQVRDRVARHESVGHEEDILEGVLCEGPV